MALGYRAGAVGGTTTNTSATLSITVPASGTGGTVIAGDVAIACIETGGANTFNSAPSGWTQRALTSNAQSNITGAIYTKTLVSGDINAAAVWVINAANSLAGAIDVISGATEASFTYSSMTVGTGTTVTSPTITIGTNGWDFGFWMGCITAGAAFTFTKDATYTAGSTRATSVVSGQNRTMGTGFISVPAGGSTAGVGCTFSASTNRNAVFSIAVAATPSVTLAGVLTDLAIAPVAGTVSAAVTMAGDVAGLAISPFAGAFVLGAGVTGNTPPGLAIAPLAGTVTGAVTMAGGVAALTLAPLAGVVRTGAGTTGVLADLALGAPAGAFGTGVAVTLAGLVGHMTVAVVLGQQVFAESPITLTGPTPPGLALAPLSGTVVAAQVFVGINAAMAFTALPGSVLGGHGVTLAATAPATFTLGSIPGLAGVLRDIALSMGRMRTAWRAGEPTAGWSAHEPRTNNNVNVGDAH